MKRQILDIPNERSSHALPTPRGGGIAIVFSFLFLVGFLGYYQNSIIPFHWVLTLFVGGGGISFVGWLDDCYKLSAKFRLLIHIMASVLAAYLLLPQATPIYLYLLSVLWISWAVNFFNFMDGIDGLAASEAVMVGLGGAYISNKFGLLGPSVVSLLIASGSLGFLFWNWHPAKIFMGDSGSGFLGYAFGCLSIASGWTFQGGLGTWTILLGLFFFDSTFTLLKRILNRENFWEAHRTHLYQQAVIAGYTHKQIAKVFIIGNIFLFFLANYIPSLEL